MSLVAHLQKKRRHALAAAAAKKQSSQEQQRDGDGAGEAGGRRGEPGLGVVFDSSSLDQVLDEWMGPDDDGDKNDAAAPPASDYAQTDYQALLDQARPARVGLGAAFLSHSEKVRLERGVGGAGVQSVLAGLIKAHDRKRKDEEDEGADEDSPAAGRPADSQAAPSSRLAYFAASARPPAAPPQHPPPRPGTMNIAHFTKRKPQQQAPDAKSSSRSSRKKKRKTGARSQR